MFHCSVWRILIDKYSDSQDSMSVFINDVETTKYKALKAVLVCSHSLTTLWPYWQQLLHCLTQVLSFDTIRR